MIAAGYRNWCAVVALLVAAVVLPHSAVQAVPYNVKLVGGASAYDQFGYFTNYFIFAEEGAPLSPPPVFEIDVATTGVQVPLVDFPTPIKPNKRRDKIITYGLNQTRTATHTRTAKHKYSKSRTIQVPKYATLQWSVRSAPFGALSAVGPKSWKPDTSNRFTIAGLRFRTAGRYDVLFNLTTLTGQHFKFNRTITVQRQPTSIAYTATSAGFNGTAMDPPPAARMFNFAGLAVLTSTVQVRLDFQVRPVGAVIGGTLTLYTDSKGQAVFNGIVPSLPGTYTFRLVATLSDGSTLYTPSQLVVIQRALPVKIHVLRGISGIARFKFYTMPLFSISDSAGASQDTRSNMTLTISGNSPFFSYDGYNTIATLSGTTSVLPVNYRYTFTDLSIDLPGSYQITASLRLVTGDTLSASINFIIESPPTFEVVGSIVVNTIGTISLFGDRPSVSPLYVMLATDVTCTQQSSDIILWTTGSRGGSPLVPMANVSLVPFRDTATYVCMKVPSTTTFAPLVQHYLQQFNEAVPLIYTFAVATVTSCVSLSDQIAAQYRVAGWAGAESGRRYGCALTPPVAGTVAPCACPAPLACSKLSHPLFTPPNLDIGQCVCCTTWVLAVAGCICALFFAAVLYTVYEWV